ncbi:MAG: metal-sulfur cluster assembly factor [Verrucomicrobia bacterium]|nr:metal-sulfur cluster assembly factor [Verrucomicrobiota bacterium]
MTQPTVSMPEESPPSVEAVRSVLRTVNDPEIGLNLVDLGVVRDIQIADKIVRISLTPTSPICPLYQVLMDGIRTAVLAVTNVQECLVQLVWDPPWDPSMISEEGKAFLANRQ